MQLRITNINPNRRSELKQGRAALQFSDLAIAGTKLTQEIQLMYVWHADSEYAGVWPLVFLGFVATFLCINAADDFLDFGPDRTAVH